MESIQLDGVKVKNINLGSYEIEYAESTGPGDRGVILFLHGFPEFWYSWRHQLQGFGSFGYKAVAPNLRGYDRTNIPAEIKDYSCMDIVGDVFSLLDEIVPDKKQKVYLVGHDWGAVLAWYMCMFRPDRFKALVNLSLIFLPRDPKHKPVPQLLHRFGPNFYVCRFQEPCEIEEEFAQLGTRDVLNGFYSISFARPDPPLLPKNHYFRPSPPRPSWLSEKELQNFVDKFKEIGFTPPINYYRNLDRNWELITSWNGAPVAVPAMLIIGDRDLTYDTYNMKDYVDGGKHRHDVPNLEKAVVIQGAGHFIQQEKPEEINELIYDFINMHI